LNVVVLAKYVPNPDGAPPEIGSDFYLRREEADGALDPSDEPAVEAGVRLIEQFGGDVRVVSVGPAPALRALRRALAGGADRAMLVSDDALRGADALGTATVLARAISREPFDLVLAGVESTDGATGTMPITLAELLALPCATFARSLVPSGSRISVERQTGIGYDVIECDLPALVTVTAGVATARFPSVRDNIAAKRKPVEFLSLAELGLDADAVRPSQHVVAIEIAPQKQAGELIEDAAEGAARIVDVLRQAQAI
jgi:electron transfer flavoprotein beta subunit